MVSWIAPSASEPYSRFVVICLLGQRLILDQLHNLPIGESLSFSCCFLEDLFYFVFLDVAALALGETIDKEGFLSLLEYDDGIGEKTKRSVKVRNSPSQDYV